MATEKPRYTVSVDDELFSRIESFKFENRFQTRSEATVELINLGLKALNEQQFPSVNPEGYQLSDETLRVAMAFDKASPHMQEIVLTALGLANVAEKVKIKDA